MALINCPECNKEISDKARSCPNCGYPISSKIVEWDLKEQDEKAKRAFLDSLDTKVDYLKKTNKKKRIVQKKDTKKRFGCLYLIIIGIIIGVILGILDDNTEEDKLESDQSSNTTNIDHLSEDVNNVMYATTNLNFRKRPRLNSDVIKVLSPNEKTYVVSKSRNGFLKVQDDGSPRKTGYCSEKYLRETPLSKEELDELEKKKAIQREKRANAWRTRDESSMAWFYAKEYVKSNLKAPRTAKFPWLDYNVDRYENQIYIVTSYVDSENSFGAMIRTNFTVKVQQVSEGNWRYLDASF